MRDLDDAYRILEVNPGAPEEVVKQQYKLLLNVWHPDRFEGRDDLRRKAEDKTKLLNAAFAAIRQARFPTAVTQQPPYPATPSPSHRPGAAPSRETGAPPPRGTAPPSPVVSAGERAYTYLLAVLGVLFTLGAVLQFLEMPAAVIVSGPVMFVYWYYVNERFRRLQ